MIRLIIVAMIGCLSLSLSAQSLIKIGGMECRYRILGDSIEWQIEAPTTGWVGIGFNQENSIVKSDLLLFRVINERIEGQDLFVVSFGNPKLDTSLGGKQSFGRLKGWEKNKKTYIQFRLPFSTTYTYDFTFKKGQPFWLILAYSVSDDFGHHSRMRKHVLFEIEE